MNYIPKQPNNQVNISQVHPLRDFAILLSGVSAVIVLIYWMLGFAVDVVVDKLPDDFEFQVELIDSDLAGINTRQSQSLQTLANSLGQCAGIANTPQIFVANNEEINAVALPNQQIWVFQGLIDKLQTENGLAFVLAHEISHFKNKDHLRAMGRGLILSIMSALLTGSNSELSSILVPGSLLGEARYSQSREAAADTEALVILNCHYGHVAGATEFFEVVQAEDSNHLAEVPFLSSHPEPTQRITALQQLAKERNYRFDTVQLKPVTEIIK